MEIHWFPDTHGEWFKRTGRKQITIKIWLHKKYGCLKIGSPRIPFFRHWKIHVPYENASVYLFGPSFLLPHHTTGCGATPSLAAQKSLVPFSSSVQWMIIAISRCSNDSSYIEPMVLLVQYMVKNHHFLVCQSPEVCQDQEPSPPQWSRPLPWSSSSTPRRSNMHTRRR